MDKLLITQIYPFLKDTTMSHHNLYLLSVLVERRDDIIIEYRKNIEFISWMDTGRVETLNDFLESEEELLRILYREFPKKHPLVRNTKKIITILRGVYNEKE